jgi:aminopeptidase
MFVEMSQYCGDADPVYSSDDQTGTGALMSVDPRITRMAQVLVQHSLGLQSGDRVVINGSTLAADLMREVYRESLRAGAFPIVQASLPGISGVLLREGNEAQLQDVSPVEQVLNQEADAELRIISEENTRALSDVSADRINAFASARSSLRRNRMQRAADGELRWSLTLFPTNAHAQDAQMSLESYREFVFDACHLNDPDPIARWRELSERQASMIDWLRLREQVQVIGPDTDLQLSIAGRIWNNSDGKRNFPSGEVFTGPIEDSVEGHVRFSFPAIIQGHEVAGIRLRFESGVVIDASAERNEDFFLSMLDTDEGARRVGEFAFGTNDGIQRFTGNTLFDEKIGGTIHLALGAGYPDTGSTNVSAIHQDLICDLRHEGEVRVDGDVFLSGGRYLTD